MIVSYYMIPMALIEIGYLFKYLNELRQLMHMR